MLSRFSILQRAIFLCVCFILILVGSQFYVLKDVKRMTRIIEGQGEFLANQQKAIATQSRLMAEQSRIADFQNTVQNAYSAYAEYLFWRYESAITADDNSIKNGDKAEARLREQLAKIGAVDEEMADVADVVTMYIDDFNATIGEAIERSKNDDSGKRIAAKVNQASSVSASMSAMFEALLESSAESAQKAAMGVKDASQKVGGAAEAVAMASEKVTLSGQALPRTLYTIMAISTLVTLAVGFLIARSITVPILKFRKVISDIEQTNDLTRKINYQGKDELNAIGQAFNSMLSKFDQIICNLSQASHSLDSAAKEAAGISHITNDNADRLREQTDMVATASAEMAFTVKGINENTETAVTQTQEASAACSDAKATVDLTEHAIKTLNDQILSSKTVIESLAEDSKTIGSVLDVIRGIAEQTNLLALNAAIEAARAGEQGRGFAVVADEVRSLAQRTGESTTEIENMIARLQESANEAVRQIESSSHRATETIERSSKTNEDIHVILSAVNAIKETSQHISEATSEQMSAAESIDQSLATISHLTGDVADAAHRTQKSSDALTALVEQLTRQVEVFKCSSSV